MSQPEHSGQDPHDDGREDFGAGLLEERSGNVVAAPQPASLIEEPDDGGDGVSSGPGRRRRTTRTKRRRRTSESASEDSPAAGPVAPGPAAASEDRHGADAFEAFDAFDAAAAAADADADDDDWDVVTEDPSRDDPHALPDAVPETTLAASEGKKRTHESRSRRRRDSGEKKAKAPGDESLSAEDSADPPERRIVINATEPEEIRIAVLEDGRLEELHYERSSDKKFVGNIYKGRVVNVEPAIQAAFVDIGIGRNGFLHVSDVLPIYQGATAIPVDQLSTRPSEWKKLKIQDILRKGQELLVQISKDSIGAKGPSLTTYISVPGKFLVLMPGVSRHGVSKRIEDRGERAVLREKLASLNPPEGVGYIIRTAGQDESQESLARDFEHLMTVWEELRRKVRVSRSPSQLYAESDLVIRAMRDLPMENVEEILIDDESVLERARCFLLDVMPLAAQRLRHYRGATPLFSKLGVEEEIERIYNRRFPLPSGAHLVIEQTEALVAIDVNSGKYRDEQDLEATALKTNLEAADEVARQLRLRDLGGVIIIDFIDMEVLPNRREVEKALRIALKRDRARSWITRISRFGIIEMTRQRVRPSLERSNYEPCSACRGSGVVKSPRSVGIGILRQVRGALAQKRRKSCEVIVAPYVAEYLLNERRRALVELETQHGKPILVKADQTFGSEHFVVRYR